MECHHTRINCTQGKTASLTSQKQVAEKHSKHHLPHTPLTKVSQSHMIMFTTIATEKWAA